MRLIDADELWKLKFKSASERLDLDIEYLGGWNDAIDSIVENAPTAEPKHGHWITWFENEDVRQAKCSECGMMFTLGKGREIHYCGNCGAKMDEVEE